MAPLLALMFAATRPPALRRAAMPARPIAPQILAPR
jgi:hypothetical protein